MQIVCYIIFFISVNFLLICLHDVFRVLVSSTRHLGDLRYASIKFYTYVPSHVHVLQLRYKLIDGTLILSSFKFSEFCVLVS